MLYENLLVKIAGSFLLKLILRQLCADALTLLLQNFMNEISNFHVFHEDRR